MENISHSEPIPVVTKEKLIDLPKFSLLYEYLNINRHPRLYKIEDGKDSIVCLWKQGAEDSVLKYYLYSGITYDLLGVYQQCVNKAANTIHIPSLATSLGEITFPILTVDRISIINPSKNESYAVSQSAYIRGFELGSASDSDHYLMEKLKDSDLNATEIQKLLLFAKAWKDSRNVFKQQIEKRLALRHTQLQAEFPSTHIYQDDINLRVSPTSVGFAIVMTDIAPDVYRFVQDIQRQKLSFSS